MRLSPPSEIDTSAPEVSARAVSPSTRAGTSTAADRSGCAGLPAQLPHGQPVPVRGDQREPVAGDLDPDAGQRGQRVIPSRGDGHLADGGGQCAAADRARQRRHLRQRRVLLFGQQDQGERGAAALEGDVGPVGDQVDRLGGQRPDDLREQTAGHQDCSVLLGHDGNGGLGGYLVVEGRQRQFCGAGVQPHPGQYGGGRAGRQPVRGPGHGLRQLIAVNSKLHGKPPPTCQCQCATAGPAPGPARASPGHPSPWPSGPCLASGTRCLSCRP